jgi:hypothetical protein
MLAGILARGSNAPGDDRPDRCGAALGEREYVIQNVPQNRFFFRHIRLKSCS